MTRLITLVLTIGISAPVLAASSDPTPAERPSVPVFHVKGLFAVPAQELTVIREQSPGSVPTRARRLNVAAQAAGDDASARPHSIGIGGKGGGFTFGVGASARVWQSERVGFQADLSHYGIGSVGLLQIAPSVLFVLGEPDLDKRTQVRPYAGGGISILRASYSGLGSETGMGGQGFAGAEMVFAGAPRFGLSGDLGYYSTGNFFGVGFGGFAMSVAGHYYIR